MLTYTYEPRYGDYKDFEVIKTGALIDYVQDVAIRDSAACGYSIQKLCDINLAWLLRGINIRLLHPVKTNAPVEIFTAVKNIKGVTSQRGCVITQNGELCAQTIADWFVFDTQKKRIAKIPKEIENAYELYDFKDDFFSFKKPEDIKIEQKVYSVRVSNKDIDTNKHLNNQKSAEMLMDALPYDFSYNDIRILYKTPAYLSQTLGVFAKETADGYYVHLENEDGEICVIGSFLNK